MTKLNIKIVVALTIVVMVYGSLPAFAIEGGEAKQFWDKCLTKMSPKCTLDIVEEIFWNGTVSDICCRELVEEGKLCHDTLIKYMADRPSFIAREPEYLAKKDVLWARCVSVKTTV
ncbi:PREDICTED: uncharacterized protein LOC104825433 [Tarenaya hassleriana]|uniref:uncharacterized protein LOC104825433 n=1 Tax=Tarenaya hassleriana TaxID=28532 RepID=UPI00053C69C6|nr:PREDICTED: uncharacterized protein LOC104825433 [Tarenaya hassleriana]